MTYCSTPVWGVRGWRALCVYPCTLHGRNTGWGGHASVCDVYHNCGLYVCAVQMCACMVHSVLKLMFYGRRTGMGTGVLRLWL